MRLVQEGRWGWGWRGSACCLAGKGLCVVHQHEGQRVLALDRDGITPVSRLGRSREVWGVRILVSTHLEDPVHAPVCWISAAKGLGLVGCFTLVEVQPL